MQQQTKKLNTLNTSDDSFHKKSNISLLLHVQRIIKDYSSIAKFWKNTSEEKKYQMSTTWLLAEGRTIRYKLIPCNA